MEKNERLLSSVTPVNELMLQAVVRGFNRLELGGTSILLKAKEPGFVTSCLGDDAVNLHFRVHERASGAFCQSRSGPCVTWRFRCSGMI